MNHVPMPGGPSGAAPIRKKLYRQLLRQTPLNEKQSRPEQQEGGTNRHKQ
jgi:hypothetical protein